MKSGVQAGTWTARLEVALSAWVEHATILMENPQGQGETYEIGSLVTQTLDFLKGDAILHWATSHPLRASQIIKCLEYPSFSRAPAGRLVTRFREAVVGVRGQSYPTPVTGASTPQDPLKASELEHVASKMVSGAVEELIVC